MDTMKINTEDFYLSSTWSCSLGKNGKYSFANGPSWGNKAVTFNYSLPGGSVIKTARIWATLGTPPTGVSVKTANGNPFDLKNGTETGADVTLPGISGPFEVTFSYKANGSTKDANSHTDSLTFHDVYLLIEYEAGDAKEEGSTEQATAEKLSGLAVPPQSVCIYDPSDGSIYMFDGVVKLQHALSMKIEEEPEKHQDEYVNNARNEPDKLTLDVIMSDVYEGDSAITRGRTMNATEQDVFSRTKGALMARSESEPWSRSENAFYVLHELKEARRRLCVITPQYVYTDMILASITANQDEEHTYGWEGQVVLQHAYKEQEKKKNNSKAKTTKGDANQTKSIWATLGEKINSLTSGKTK